MQPNTLTIDKPIVVSSEKVLVTIASESIKNYSQFQIDVFSCGVDNPAMVWASGAPMDDANSNVACITIDSAQLPAGVFEVKVVTFHTPRIAGTTPDHLQIVSGTDFPRVFLEVFPIGAVVQKGHDLAAMIKSKEDEREAHFLDGISAIGTPPEQNKRYCVFTLLVGVLVTSRLRFDRWEVVPFHGLDAHDSFAIAHDFLATRTELKFKFPYTDDAKEISRRSKPVCVVHFPLIYAPSNEVARDYCRGRAFMLGHALSAHRGATPETICSIVYDIDADKAKLFTEEPIYRGNLAGGAISGENAETIEASVNAITKSAQMRYFYLLYSNARSEEQPDFQYLRYWQFLEAVAESKNYDEEDVLLNFNGDPILMEDETPQKIAGPRSQVFELVKSHKLAGGVGESNVFMMGGEKVQHSLLEMVNFWYAMRNAAAHFGCFLPEDKVQKERFRYYGKCMMLKKLTAKAGYDYILSDLRSIANLVLLRETRSHSIQ